MIAGISLEASDFVQFQDSIPHPALYEPRRAFAGVIRVTSEQLAEVRRQIVGQTAGLADEGEYTKVGILSLREALDQAPADVFESTLVKFMRTFDIPIPSLRKTLPMPYLNLAKN